MTDLSRSLLEAARQGITPDAAVAARVKAKVAAAIAASAAGTAATTSASATAETAAVTAPAVAPVAPIKAAGSSSLLFKLGAALLVVGTVATTAVVLHERRPDAPHLAVATTDDVDEPRANERVASHDEAPLAPTAPRVRKGPAGEPGASGATIDPRAIEIDEPASLSREVELIDLAMAALRSGVPGAALQSLATFERETFGRGQMAQDAAAIDLEARCMLGEEVTERLAAFDRKYPSSAQRARITTACRR